ncbi:MFS transporter [Amycolatopsis rubida]|uniref:Sugar transporter n=1 Tax=Amycolatopsis rubida TaxID=112413 RepID=A0A1I5LQ47_9PSEU|nr:MFS transporter [Amycolatopsis rubida]SFO99355.1 Sugar transporter [Amycolatopsis rubida]
MYFADAGTAHPGLGRNTVLAAGIAGGRCWSLGTVIGAMASDRAGRRPILLAATGAAVVPVSQSASGMRYLALLCATTLIAGWEIGSITVMLSEIFEARYRCTASAFAYNVGLVTGGAVPPLGAGASTAAYGAVVFGAFPAVWCSLSAIAHPGPGPAGRASGAALARPRVLASGEPRRWRAEGENRRPAPCGRRSEPDVRGARLDEGALPEGTARSLRDAQ